MRGAPAAGRPHAVDAVRVSALLPLRGRVVEGGEKQRLDGSEQIAERPEPRQS